MATRQVLLTSARVSRVKSNFRDVIERVCSGSEDAVWEFIEAYGPHLQRVVRKRLSKQLRSRFDSADYVQMVWASFFTDRETIARFADANELIRYLTVMARNKVVQEVRRSGGGKGKEIRQEEPIDREGLAEPDRRQATPSQIAIARERFKRMYNGLSERDRRVVQLRMSGLTFTEIGDRLAIHERTARQIIGKLAGQNPEVAAGTCRGPVDE